MISLITDPAQLSNKDYGPLNPRILGQLKAYGTGYDFALFWRQVVDGEETAIISSLDQSFTLCADDCADREELAEFLGVVAGGEIMCTEDCAAGMGLRRVDSFTIYRLESMIESVVLPVKIDFSPPLDAVYRTLKSREGADIVLPGFESWYADMSHKIRHRSARAVTVLDGEIAAVAVTSYETDRAAIISGVAVLPEAEGRGFGRAAVRALCGELPCAEIYAFAHENAGGFYEKLGFKAITTAGRYRVGE